MKKYEFDEFNGDEFLMHLGVPENYINVRKLFMKLAYDNTSNWPRAFEEFKEKNGDVPKIEEVRRSVNGKYLKIMLGGFHESKRGRITYLVKVNKFDSIRSKDTLFCTGFVYNTGRKKSSLTSSFTIEVRGDNIDFRKVNKIYELSEIEFNDIVNEYLNSIGIFL